MVVDGAMNGEMFLAYVEQWCGNIVVMDNLPTQKVADIDETIKSAGATLRYLAKYRQIQSVAAQGCPTYCSESLQGDPLFRAAGRCSGMRKLIPACWLFFRMTAIGFRLIPAREA
jgi:hypothetical protein